MKTDQVLKKVYALCTMVIVSIIVLACLVCKWPWWMTAVAVLASIVISSPATLSLQVLLWMVQVKRLERSFVWILLMASIPLLSFLVAWLFAGFVPGKPFPILLLGMLTGYAGLLRNGISVASLFNSTIDED